MSIVTPYAAGPGVQGSTALSSITSPSHSPGDILFLPVAAKGTPAVVPPNVAGWTLSPTFFGGLGNGVDQGFMTGWVYWKVAQSSSESFPTLTVAAANCMVGVMHRLSNATGLWDVAVSGAAKNVAGVNWSSTADTDPGLIAGDVIFAYCMMNTDGSGAVSSRSISAPDISMVSTLGAANQTTTQGQDCRMNGSYGVVSSGVSTGPPTYATTFATGGTNAPAGSTLFMRFREVSASPPSTSQFFQFL